MPTLPKELPATLQFPLAADTYDWVKPCYQLWVKADQNNRLTNNWASLKIEGLEGLNPSLFLNKFCPDAQALKAHKNNNARSAFFSGWIELANSRPAAPADALVERRIELLQDLKQDQGRESRTLVGAVAWRMIIGMGNPNPLETSLTLHSQYGIPLIPGSAIKGLARHGRLLSIGSEIGVYPLSPPKIEERRAKHTLTPLGNLECLLLSDTETERQKLLTELRTDPAVLETIAAAVPCSPVTGPDASALLTQYALNFRQVFGAEQSQGQVAFLDALPLPGWTYELDVMTPHYGDYYQDAQNQTPPADWLDPNPISFLTIGHGSRFRFDVSGQDDVLLGEVVGWLKKALSELGAGGKTNAGYGEIS